MYSEDVAAYQQEAQLPQR